MDDQQIKHIIRKTRQAWFEDGIWEIGFGLAPLLISLYYWVLVWFNLFDRLGLWTTLLQLVVFLIAFGIARWAMVSLKERFAFPRTGYVTYRRESGSRRLQRAALGAVVGVLVGGTAVIFNALGDVEARMPALFGLLIAGVMLYLGLNYALRRFLVIGAMNLLLGGLISWLRPEVNTSIAIQMSAFGFLILAAGGLALWRFVRRYPLEEPGEPE